MDTKTLLSDTPEHLIQKYKIVLEKAGIPVEKMILFGSYAKKTATAGSDVDVCVVSPIFGKEPFDEMLRLSKLTMSVDTMIEPHPYNAQDLENKYDALAKEIRTYGIVI